MSTPIADDFSAIRARLAELRAEKERAIAGDAETRLRENLLTVNEVRAGEGCVEAALAGAGFRIDPKIARIIAEYLKRPRRPIPVFIGD